MATPETEEPTLADTARLRGLSTFPRVQVLLGELITDQKLIPSGSRTVTHLEGLPAALKGCIQKAERLGNAWCSWIAERELFAITGRIDDVSSRMYAKPVLQVLLYDAKGRVIGSSTWLERRSNQWTACEA
jgi:hypothetical protein